MTTFDLKQVTDAVAILTMMVGALRNDVTAAKLESEKIQNEVAVMNGMVSGLADMALERI